MSSTVVKWLLLITVLCVVQLDCEIYQDRPKIKTVDGDLILEPALDKSIYLRPNGPKSGIYIGYVDMLKIKPTKDGVQNLPAISDNLDKYLNGPNGVLERLDKLENRETPASDLGLLNITLLWRRVNNLHRKVIALQHQINSKPKDECDSQPCQHGGTCLNLVDGHYCLCPSNWEGKDCDVDVNECQRYFHTDLGCQNGAICVNKPGTYECLCKPNWYGQHCTQKAKDCSGGNFEMCGHGTCVPVTTGEGITCICNQGWTKNATSVACLTDINECESRQGPSCSTNPRVECINLPGSFQCGQCPAGYEGDGYICNDIDECTSIPNGGCSPMVTCHNTIGSRICGPCPTGYRGDGITCSFIGSCSVNHGGCHPSAECVESLSPLGPGVQCLCPEGMEGDGRGLVGCYVSAAYGNFTSGCENNPCGSHGRCHSLRTGYTCFCYKGYSGAHCDTPTDTCVGNPCQNGGICKQDNTKMAGFRCECSAQYSGPLCQVRAKACGGILDAEEGTIAYPMSNFSTYNNEAQCAWVIHTAPDKVINVTFSKFNIELTPECAGDFLQIHDGRKSSSQLIGRFCGNTFPKDGNIISSHNNLYFWFHSDRSITKEGFALHWTSIKPVCGGEIDATNHGHISSPGSPGRYPPNRDCYWHLTTTPGKRISLHFFALDIESHTNCSFDYLAIYDGEHTTDPLLSRYCNSSQPAPVQSAGSEILIYFHSDSYGSGNGFQIAFAPVEGIPGCGGYYTSDKGEIVSPTYDGTYMSNILCEYKIKTSLDTKITIHIKSFKLENSFRCRYDYLKIYDGLSSDSRIVGKFCGETFPATYTSTSNALYLKFKTDHSVGAEGFRINYEAVCEKSLVGDSGIITSPSYPFAYPENKICVYIIKTEPGKAIQLTFQDFNIEDNRYVNCEYDYVEVRDGPDINSTLLGRYCGGSEHIPPVQTSTHNFMYIRFKSDTSLAGTGFYANYTTIDTECGGIFKETTGLINHPTDKTYKNDQSCQWLLIAPEGMHIKLSWNRFEIEDTPECNADYLEITELDKDDANVLGKYCGTRTPPALTTTSNRLKLKFVSDSDTRYTGFSASYTFLDERTHCGGNYIKSQGLIYSPGWPRDYEPNRDCTWIIMVPAGQQISLNISNFDLERPIRERCNLGDYLEIRNGASQTSPLIGQFCGKFLSRRITSLSNVLYLHFHSDFYLTGKGFRIEWDGTVNGCGGTLTSSSGSISSPNYPNEYHQNSECFYKIVTSSGSRIRISFTELELEQTAGCRDDYIQIFDGRDTNAPSLGKHCHMSTDLGSVETSSNYAFIKFRSDLYISAKGFVLNYVTICNNNITGRYGAIESPGYPNNYPLNTKCLWNIQAPVGNKINVTFTHFDIYKLRGYRYWYRRRPSNEECYTDYLQTKELSDSTFSKKICGMELPNAITTKSNTFQIQFISGPYASRSGFRLEWASYGCGGHIQKQYGTVSLDRSVTTEKEMECEWLIESSPGKSITLTFTNIYVSSSKDCSIDTIEIYNGQNTKSPLISKICHETIASVQSQSNFMLIHFKKRSSLRDVHFDARFFSSQATCGGALHAASGYFNSINYPKNYDNNLNCMWYITVPMYHRIEINFLDFDLYSISNVYDNSQNDNCGDSILIYDTPIINYTARICPDSKTGQVITKTNSAVIKFKTDSEGTAKGFRANFTTTCGARISATQDGIITNNRFINYSNKSCVWNIISSSLDQKISLTLTHMALPRDTNVVTNRHCPSGFLRVLDGDDSNAPLIGEYCGRKVPPMIVSRGNAITLELGSYTDNIFGMFSAHYSPLTNTCGGTLTAEEGSIASPAYPSPYPTNIDCEWILNTSPGNTAYITFEQFDLEYSEGCNDDYLEIRENNGAGRLMGLYCGSDIPTNYTKASKMYIKFFSNSKTSGRGFVLHYGYLRENEIQGVSGEISSPLYPLYYHGSGEYVWRILSFGQSNLAITIDRLEIPGQGDISFNKLTVYDGFDKSAPILDQLYGFLGETKTLQASANAVYIVLTMDTSNTGSLFHLSWTQSSNNDESSNPEDRVNCGSNGTELILPGQKNILKSPNYPEDYGNNLNCEWIYKTTTGRHLSLTFAEMKIEEIHACFADSISIYSARSPGSWEPVKENICESSAVTSETNSSIYMKIKFKTDASVTRKGFLAYVRSKCGGFITDLSGELGPIWSDVMTERGKVRCDWTIKVRAGRTIQLRFSHFNITNNQDNCINYVVLRNGDSVEAPLLESGKYCGYEHEKKIDIVTSSNSLFVSYTSEAYRPIFQNFKIYYSEQNEECGATATLTSDHNWEVISSPKFPNPPNPYSECVWVFSGPPGEIIRIDFLDRFDLDYTDGCGTEFVEIHDGSSSLSPLLKGRFCGEKPATVKSTSNTIYVKYFTQLETPRNGFKANVSIDVCGGTIFAESGEVQSPEYPHMHPFPYGTTCEWRVIGPPRHVLLINVVDVNLPMSQSYCASKIEIEETIPINNTVAILKTICSADILEKSNLIQTSNNHFIIKLTFGKPDEWSQLSAFRGFRITFNSSIPSCGGRITTSEGFLTTPSYPQETTLRYCQWLIDAPNKSRRVRLELIDINQEKQIISMFNDLSFRNLIQRIPSDNYNPTNKIFESVGNKLGIFVWLNRSASTHRFKAKFSTDLDALCGGDLSGISRELVSPDFQRSYKCEWHYNNRVLVDSQYNLTYYYNSIYITAFVNSSVTRTRCRYSDPQVNIRSPINNFGNTIRRELCGNTEMSYRIPSSIVDIDAIKPRNSSFYFHLNIKSQPCGGIIHAGESLINILGNIPSFYNDTLECAWIVKTPISSKIEITMQGSFLLECDDEFITITQGLSQNSPSIGSYCKGKLLESPLDTNYPYLYIQYHSKAKNNSNLRLMAQTSTKSCGGLLTYSQKIFSSPNYPKPYSSNMECTWEIKAELGFRISLNFIDRFAVEDRKNCTKDVIIIYDWKDTDYQEISRVCGRQAPPAFNSTYHKLKVVFRTDAETNLDGFRAEWTSICGGKFIATEREQTIFSPGYPYNYRPNMDCLYDISSANNQKIFVKFQEFELEGDLPECLFDNVTITGNSDYNYVNEVFCGTTIPHAFRSYEALKLHFRSDRSIQRMGFRLSYSLYRCGGKINNTTIISSTLDTELYDENLNCTWIIQAPPTKIVVVKFLYIDLEVHTECYNDHVALYDGPNINDEKRLALLCGFEKSPTVLRSTGNNMVLEFITDSSLNYKGFKALVYFSYSEKSGCGGKINLNSDSSYVLKSPLMGHGGYGNFLDCHWSITSPPATLIKITFTKFHIAPCTNVNQTAIGTSKCDCDLIEIKDGLNPNSLLIGRYCGHTLPPQLLTSDNIMSFRLSTDGELVSSGFEATLTVQPSLCGKTEISISTTPRRFKSPGYDAGVIPRGIHCLCHLINNVDRYAQIRITVMNLSIRGPSTDGTALDLCKDDRLIISSATSHSNNTFGKDLIMNNYADDFFTHHFFYDSDLHFPTRFELCGNKKSVDFYVYGNTSINLITSPNSDNGIYKGVEIEVALMTFCGRNYSEPQGRIQSSYGTESIAETITDCYTLITAPENYTISGYFLSLIPDYFDPSAYLEIFDGKETSARQLVKINNAYEDSYPVFSTGRYMLLHNRRSSNRVIFDMNYVTTNKGAGCGGILSNVIGAITSPLYPNTYRHTRTCEWELTTPAGTHLMLRFSAFDLGVICDQNYVQLVNSKGETVRTFCSEMPADYTSDDNYVKVVFHTSRNNSGKGWSAQFIAIEK